MENNLISVEDLKAKISIPFTFSFEESLKRIGIKMAVTGLNFNTTPIDFEDFSQLMVHGSYNTASTVLLNR